MRRRGVTLLELLVAVGIMALLCGLLLGAVQKVRAAALRAQSMNNMRQINLAMHSYSAGYGSLPAINDYLDRGPFLAILPFVENNRKVFVSPADPSLHFRNPSRPFYPDLDPDTVYASYAYNAVVFKDKLSFDNGFPDGLSHTISLTEHYARCAGREWPVFIYSLQSSSGDGGPHRPSFADRYYGDVVPVTVGSRTVPSVPEVTFQVTPNLMESDATMPQTPHAGGILVGMMDGGVRVVRAGVLPEVFWGAVTPDGGEVLEDF